MENDKAGYNIVVKDFNDNGDRLSLKEKKSNPIFRWNYTITNSTIKRDGVDDVVVEGSRVDQLSDPQALQESFGLVKYR